MLTILLMKITKTKATLLTFLLISGGVLFSISTSSKENAVISSSLDNDSKFSQTPKEITLKLKNEISKNTQETLIKLYFSKTKTEIAIVKAENRGKDLIISLPILDIGEYNLTYLKSNIKFTINRDNKYLGVNIQDCTSLESKSESFLCLQNYFQDKVIREKTSVTAINELTQAGKSNVLLRGTDCHMWAHVIGYTQAMQSENDYKNGFNSGSNSCQSGYIHGLVEGYAVMKSKDALAKLLPTFCQNYDPAFTANPGACLHSLGHMTWFRSGGDLNRALELCEFAGDKPYGSYTAKGFCASGAAMNWAYTYLAASKEEKLALSYNEIEPTYVCKKQSDPDLREGCYGFITAVWGGSISELEHMADICNSLSPRDSNSCWLNLGSVQSIQKFSEQSNAIKFCFKAKSNSAFWLCQNNVVEEFAHILLKSGTAELICKKVEKDREGYLQECEKLKKLEEFNLKNAQDINHLHVKGKNA